jgi:sugar phosphate isomerase/epimerase
MVPTLEAGSLARIVAGVAPGGTLQLEELPEFASREFGVRGLSIPAELLSGRPLREIERLRDAADKAGCPCLLLTEHRPLLIAGGHLAAGVDRLVRLAGAASSLGCSCLAVSPIAEAGGDADSLATGLRSGLLAIERFELNLLVIPSDSGDLSEVAGVIDLIRRVGGFKIGCMPTFRHALSTRDPEATLRKLAPYAAAIEADLDGLGLGRSGEAKVGRVLLKELVEALRAVGYANTLALASRAENSTSLIGKTHDFLRELLAAVPEQEGAA